MALLTRLLFTTSAVFMLGCASQRKLEDLELGIPVSQVEEKLGEPIERKPGAYGEVYVYDLMTPNRVWQALLAVPTFGLIFCAQGRYELTITEQHLTSIDQKGMSKGQRACYAIAQGFSHANGQRTVSCTSRQYGDTVYTQCN